MRKRKKMKYPLVKRPGALTRKARRAGKSPSAFAEKHYHSKGLLGKEARFAVIAG